MKICETNYPKLFFLLNLVKLEKSSSIERAGGVCGGLGKIISKLGRNKYIAQFIKAIIIILNCQSNKYLLPSSSA
jgi:hypothetical protein